MEINYYVMLYIIRTYNVQKFEVISNVLDTITLKCTFAFNSTAVGCLVVFSEVNTGYIWNITIDKFRNQASATVHARVTNSKSGRYSILVYDILHGSRDKPAISYEHIISLTASSLETTKHTSKFITLTCTIYYYFLLTCTCL